MKCDICGKTMINVYDKWVMLFGRNYKIMWSCEHCFNVKLLYQKEVGK